MKRFLFVALAGSCALAQSRVDPADAGPKIIAEAFGKLSAALGEAIAKDGATKALGACSERAPQIADEIGKARGVTIRRASEKPRNPKNTADDEETKVLAAFADAMAKSKAPKPQIVTHPDGSVSFFAPIVLGNPLCLQCHGTPNQEVAPETLTAIRKLYPDDKATGFKLGDLRGLWHVTFPTSK